MTPFFRRLRANNNTSSNPPNGAPAAPTSTSRSAPFSNSNRTAPLICHTCRQPISKSTRHIHTSRTLSGERRYHRPCFLCLHCNAPIDPQTQSFCYAKLENTAANNNSERSGEEGEDEHPFHRECFAHHFGWMCVVCEKPLPMVTKFNNPTDDPSNNTAAPGAPGAAPGAAPTPATGAAPGTAAPSGKSTKVEFLKHPFFDKERMCPHHAGPITEQVSRHVQQQRSADAAERSSRNTTTSEEVIGEIRRCAGCHRFEPLFASRAKHFIDVGDSDTGRCVCLACCRTVVTSSEDVIPLWDKVIDFFEGPLGLITSEDSLNGASGVLGYRDPKRGVTRRDLKNIPIMVVGHEALNDNMKQNAHFGSKQIMTRGICLSEHCAGDHNSIGVTAIMCLSGLPADLTASILAHEATHAWIKLHPNFPFTDPLPLRVEEGICQLVAHLFLHDGLDPIDDKASSTHSSSTGTAPSEGAEDDSNPSDERLRQYFRFCIETDDGVYGEGFRLAARAYAKLGIQELLYHVAVHRDFPSLDIPQMKK